jgi:hypothetical protein
MQAILPAIVQDSTHSFNGLFLLGCFGPIAKDKDWALIQAMTMEQRIE